MITTPIPAATVIIMDGGAENPRFLMVHRNPQVPVQGNIWVFPGGRLAPNDAHNNSPEKALRACAVRETKEEAGLTLDPKQLINLLQWITPEALTHRFDTRFFIAPVSPQPAVQVDGREIIDHRWLSATEALRAHSQKAIELSPPAYVLMSWVRYLGSAQKLLEYVRSLSLPRILPHLIPVDDGACNIFPEDTAYESGDLNLPGNRHRLWMCASGWRYEGNPLYQKNGPLT